MILSQIVTEVAHELVRDGSTPYDFTLYPEHRDALMYAIGATQGKLDGMVPVLSRSIEQAQIGSVGMALVERYMSDV
jgi:hypothetical protein